MWILETFTGQNVRKSAIEAAHFGTISPGTRQIWDTNYIETQYQSFAKREAISFTELTRLTALRSLPVHIFSPFFH
ncbi:MAG: hypothetical protein Q7U66_06695 [Methylobacter sp.]|nr:hypothetical protein [Methylobacter sp.]